MTHKERRKLHRDAAGSTIVEVLVAVIVVMLMMAVISVAMTTVMDLWNRSSNKLQSFIAYDAEYYKVHDAKDLDVKKVGFTLTMMDGDSPAAENVKLAVEGVSVETFRTPQGQITRSNLRPADKLPEVTFTPSGGGDPDPGEPGGEDPGTPPGGDKNDKIPDGDKKATYPDKKGDIYYENNNEGNSSWQHYQSNIIIKNTKDHAIESYVLRVETEDNIAKINSNAGKIIKHGDGYYLIQYGELYSARIEKGASLTIPIEGDHQFHITPDCIQIVSHRTDVPKEKYEVIERVTDVSHGKISREFTIRNLSTTDTIVDWELEFDDVNGLSGNGSNWNLESADKNHYVIRNTQYNNSKDIPPGGTYKITVTFGGEVTNGLKNLKLTEITYTDD